MEVSRRSDEKGLGGNGNREWCVQGGNSGGEGQSDGAHDSQPSRWFKTTAAGRLQRTFKIANTNPPIKGPTGKVSEEKRWEGGLAPTPTQAGMAKNVE